jgi:hypothetical protein
MARRLRWAPGKGDVGKTENTAHGNPVRVIGMAAHAIANGVVYVSEADGRTGDTCGGGPAGRSRDRAV